MYGTETTAGSATLAATGLATGSIILASIGIILAGIALIALVRKNGNTKP